MRLTTRKISWVKADAASSSAISSLVNQVLAEEGHLDFYFANAGIVQPQLPRSTSSADAKATLKTYMSRTAKDIPEEEYMHVMRVNALRWEGVGWVRQMRLILNSVFLAIKFGAPAMAKLCPEKGKNTPGGSLILTASGKYPA